MSEVISSRGVKRPNPSPYLVFGLLGLCVCLIGFSPTYFRPVLIEAKTFPAIFHLHGFFGAAWVLLFLTQTLLIRSRQRVVHRRLGFAGGVVALGVVLTLPLVAYTQISMDIAAGGGKVANILGPTLDALMFALLVTCAIALRRKPESHKRFMFLATTLLLWVAWVRWRYFFPDFPGNFTFFGFFLAMSPVPVFWIYEWKTLGRIHPVLLFGGLALLLQQGLQVLTSDSAQWASLAQVLFDHIGSVFGPLLTE